MDKVENDEYRILLLLLISIKFNMIYLHNEKYGKRFTCEKNSLFILYVHVRHDLWDI